MIDIAKLKVGDKVHYISAGSAPENGIVKEIPTHTNNAVRIVYYCNGNWDNFMGYTSALTNIENLRLGWSN